MGSPNLSRRKPRRIANPRQTFLTGILCAVAKGAGVVTVVVGAFGLFLVWVYKFSGDASPNVVAFRDSFDSCVGVGLANAGMHTMSFFSLVACSDLVNAAAIRGQAAFERGNATHYEALALAATTNDVSNSSSSSSGTNGSSSGEVEIPEKDGCSVTYDPSVDPRDIKPTSAFTYSSCSIEWITFSTRCGKGVQRLAKFCDLVGIPFAVMGLNGSWPGQGGRVRYTREYLRTLPRDRIVITTDADDVMMLPNREICGPEQMIKAFLSLNAPVVFGAERFAYPSGKVIPFYPQKLQTPFPNRYLNAGTYVGYAWAIAEMIDAVYTGDCMEDQRQLVTAYLAQPYLFNSMPRTPYPEADFPSIQSLLSQEELSTTDDANSASRKLKPFTLTPGTLRYFCPLPGPLQHLIPEDVTPEKLEEARQAAPPPFIKMDHYSTLMEQLGGRLSQHYEVQGTGTETKVYSRVTKAYPCVFHQCGDKRKHLIMKEIAENGTLDEIAFEGMGV